MEKWHIVNHGFIPKGRYYTKLEHGESRGLIIYLEDDDYLISLDFGAAIAFHFIKRDIMKISCIGSKIVLIKNLFSKGHSPSINRKSFIII